MAMVELVSARKIETKTILTVSPSPSSIRIPDVRAGTAISRLTSDIVGDFPWDTKTANAVLTYPVSSKLQRNYGRGWVESQRKTYMIDYDRSQSEVQGKGN